MLWAYTIGIIVYLIIGTTIGRMSWHVWDRDVKFSKTEKSGDDRWYYCSVQRSWGMRMLFPTTSRKKTFCTDDEPIPFITLFLDHMLRRLNENRHIIYVALLATFWPIKVAANALIILLPLAIMLLQKTVWFAYGVMCLPSEFIAKTPKRNMECYRCLWPTAADNPHEAREENGIPKLRVANKTYKQRLQELQYERDKTANRTAELDREIAAVTHEMEELQGGVFRASDNLEMTDADKAKLAG